MRDPIQYLIDEGFIAVYCWIEDGQRPIKGALFGFAPNIAEKIKFDDPTNRFKFHVDGVGYSINSEFYNKYGVLTLDKDSAVRQADETMRENLACSEYCSKIDPKI